VDVTEEYAGGAPSVADSSPDVTPEVTPNINPDVTADLNVEGSDAPLAVTESDAALTDAPAAPARRRRRIAATADGAANSTAPETDRPARRVRVRKSPEQTPDQPEQTTGQPEQTPGQEETE
jgi:hypothetical protein